MKQIKKFLCVMFCVIFVFSLTGCDAIDYNKANTYVQEEKYEEAIEIYARLGDYSDSKEKLSQTIKKMANELTYDSEYDRIISTIEKYEHLGDFSKEKSEAIYRKGIKCLEKNTEEGYKEGFELFSQIPEGTDYYYERAVELKNHYEELKKANYSYPGSWSGIAVEPISGNRYQCYITIQDISYNLIDFGFKIHKTMYEDGFKWLDEEFFAFYDSINGNTMEAKKYTFTLEGNTLIENDKGFLTHYTK